MRAWVRLVLSKAVWIVLVATGPYTPSGTRSMKPVLQIVVQATIVIAGAQTFQQAISGFTLGATCSKLVVFP
eukprot:8699347-Ditylum_brightwellii.AAC.1